MRHRAEYLAVMALRSRLCGSCRTRSCGRMGAALGLTFYAVDRVHRRVAATNLATAFPKRSAAERRQITRAMFVHFGRLLFELLRFSTLTPRRCAAAWNSTARSGRARVRARQGRVVLHRPLRLLGDSSHRSRPRGAAGRCAGPRARQSLPNALLESVRGSTGNWVIYRHGAVRRVLRALSPGRAWRS